MSSKNLMLLVSALAVTASPLAMADALVNVKSEVVRYDDVRLISAVGAAVLYGRLHAAAERVCDGMVDRSKVALKQRSQACVDDAVARAVADVNNSVLTQYFKSKRAGTAPSGPGVTSASVTGASAVAKER